MSTPPLDTAAGSKHSLRSSHMTSFHERVIAPPCNLMSVVLLCPGCRCWRPFYLPGAVPRARSCEGSVNPAPDSAKTRSTCIILHASTEGKMQLVIATFSRPTVIDSSNNLVRAASSEQRAKIRPSLQDRGVSLHTCDRLIMSLLQYTPESRL